MRQTDTGYPPKYKAEDLPELLCKYTLAIKALDITAEELLELLNHHPVLEQTLQAGNPLPNYYWHNRPYNFIQAVRLGDYVVIRDEADYLSCRGIGFWLEPDSPLRNYLLDLDEEGQHHDKIPSDLYEGVDFEDPSVERIEGFFDLEFLNLARLVEIQAQNLDVAPVPVAYERFAPAITHLKEEIMSRLRLLEQITQLHENSLPSTHAKNAKNAREILFDITQQPPTTTSFADFDPYAPYAKHRPQASAASPFRAL
jgi:hypothetical protein